MFYDLCCNPQTYDSTVALFLYKMELACHSSCVMDCHVTAQGSIPGGNGVKLSFTSFARDSKWGRLL